MIKIITIDCDLYQAQLGLPQLRLQKILSVVQLCKAQGGAWQ